MAQAEIAIEGRLRFYRCDKAVILAKTPMGAHKIARITFGKDGSIYVQFPYLDKKDGVIAELPVDPDVEGPVTYRLGDLGTRVATDVKFSHHASGEVRFSKTGHRITAPTRQSFPLDGPIGRVFELSLFDLTGFAEFSTTKKNTAYLGFNFPDGADGLVLRAQWRRKADIVANIHPPGQMAGPATTAVHRRTGIEEAIYFFGAPLDRPNQDHVLVITSAPVEPAKGADRPSMVFLGGWDPHEQAPGEEPRRLGNCLAFLYPIDVPEQQPKGGRAEGARDHGG